MADAAQLTPAAAALAELAADGSTRSRVVLAAIELVEEVGADSLTVAMLVERSGVARATIYNHFGGVVGAVATAWTEVGSLWLEHAMDAGFDPGLDVPLVDILVAARREPELREVVEPDLALAWKQVAERGPVAELRGAWLLMGVVGTVLSRATFPAIDRFGAIADVIAALPDDLDLGGIPPAPESFPPVSATTAWFDGGDPIRRRLLEASEIVVAGAGYQHASMLRICRSARLTTGATTPRFASLTALHLEAFEHAISGVVRDNAEQVSVVLPELSPEDTYALHIPRSLDPSRSTWRSYRQEILYATRVDPELAVGVQSAFDDANQAFALAMSRLGIAGSTIDFAVVINQVVSTGAPAIHALGLPLDELDHRPVLRSLVAALGS